MNFFTFLFLFFIGSLSLGAQSKNILNQYFLPGFKEGTIYYKEGAVIKGKLNYNLLTNRMFVLDNNEKKELPDMHEIEYVGLGLIKFVMLEEGDFGEIKVDGDKAILALRHAVDVIKTDPSAKGFTRNGLDKFLETQETVPEGIALKGDSTYYLVRQTTYGKGFSLAQRKVERANYRGFTKIFSAHKSTVDNYIKEQNINFKNLEDLTKLTLFCENL